MPTNHHPNNYFAAIGFLILCLLVPLTSSAQVTVTVSHFFSMFTPGQSGYFRHLDSAYNTVYIGKKGGPNIYDYSLAKLTPAEISNNFSVSTIPVLAARFPKGAVTFGSTWDSIEKNPVFLLSGDTVFVTGEVSLVPVYRFKHKRPYQPMIFPATYQGTYRYSGIIYDTTFNSTGGVASVKTGVFNDSVIVDGYGTLKTPGAQFECLRVKVMHAATGEKDIMFLTREGAFASIAVAPGQLDTGFVQVASVTVRLASGSTAISSESALPTEFGLRQNFPNPFNPTTNISYSLPRAAAVSLKIFNGLGQVVGMLVDEQKDAGYHQVQWNADVPSGIYFYRLQTGGFVETKKMVLVK
jgi:hypothetical protein